VNLTARGKLCKLLLVAEHLDFLGFWHREDGTRGLR
jgi:hypothetical protein